MELDDEINTRPDLVRKASFGWLIGNESIFNFGRIVLTSTPFPGSIPMKYGSSYAKFLKHKNYLSALGACIDLKFPTNNLPKETGASLQVTAK